MATIIDSGVGGGSVPSTSVIPLPETIANNTTFTLPLSGKQGVCWIRYSTDNYVLFDFYTDGTVNIRINDGFGNAVDTAGKMNLYQDGTDIKVQNKTGGDIAIIYNPEAK